MPDVNATPECSNAPQASLPKSDSVSLERGRGERVADQAGALTRQFEERSLRMAVAQVKTLPTRFEHNLEVIKDYLGRAAQLGAEVLVFPELAIPGYFSSDHFQSDAYIAVNIEMLKRVAALTKDSPVTVIVGFVDKNGHLDTPAMEKKPYNSAAVLEDGEIKAIVDKTLLPQYDIFWEPRYFAQGKRREPVMIKGHRVGIELCEDLWDHDYSEKISDDLAAKGAEIMINLSCSPFEIGKVNKRAELIGEKVARHGVPFVYANLVGAQDGFYGEVVFDGRSMAYNARGELIALGKSFEEDLVCVDLFRAEPIRLPSWTPAQETYEALALALKDYCARNGFKRVCLGVSGGIDSAVTAAIAVDALGAENVIGVTMPSAVTSEETLADSHRLMQELGLREPQEWPIGEGYLAWEKEALQHFSGLDRIARQNVQARLRGMILMSYTNQDHEVLLVSTGNKTEVALSYCTLYGDTCGGLDLLGDCSKSLVYAMAEYALQKHGREIIPRSIIERVPSAELEPNQADRDSLPADYPVLSPLVDDIVERRLPREELSVRYGAEVSERAIAMVQRSEYKRRQLAPAPRVTGKAFGAGRRYPIDSHFY